MLFVSEQFAKADIRKLNKDNLEEYLLALIKEKKMKSKALLNCKGVLNLIFQEAIDEGQIHENITKEVNNRPVTLPQKIGRHALFKTGKRGSWIGQSKVNQKNSPNP